MNEQMNQLGKIGGVGYDSTGAVIDQLVGRAKRARAIRQGSAAILGSLGALSLGLLGAQVFVNITQDQDAGTMPIRDLADTEFSQLKEPGYTGLGKSPEELAAWAKIQSAATITPAAPAEVTEPSTEKTTTTCSYEEKVVDGWLKIKSPDTGCVWTKDHKITSEVPAGSIEFGGIIAPCKDYYDAATGSSVFAAFIDAGGSWKKIVKCEGGPTDFWSGSYRYIYNGGAGDGWHATLSGTTCTGYEKVADGKVYQYICNPNYGSYDNPWKYIRDVTPTPTPTVTPEPEPEPTPTGPEPI